MKHFVYQLTKEINRHTEPTSLRKILKSKYTYDSYDGVFSTHEFRSGIGYVMYVDGDLSHMVVCHNVPHCYEHKIAKIPLPWVWNGSNYERRHGKAKK